MRAKPHIAPAEERGTEQLLGEIEKVYVMSGVKSEDGEAFSLNAISNNTDNTPITVIYQKGKYAAWFQ